MHKFKMFSFAIALGALLALPVSPFGVQQAQAGPLMGAIGGAIGGGIMGRIIGGRRGARIGRVIGGFTGMVRGARRAARRRDRYYNSYYQPYPPPQYSSSYSSTQNYSSRAAAPAPAPATDPLISSIQQALAGLGYNPGPVDGRSGPKVTAAIRAYQQDKGLLVTGQPSQQLLQHMQRQN